MTLRATWKGRIRLGERAIPIKLYAAAPDTHVRFHLLHRDDGVRVEQRIVNPTTNEPVDESEIRKGFALGNGAFVLIDESDLEPLAVKGTRDVEVARLVSTTALAPAWFERPYLVGPDGAATDYLAFARALADSEQQAIVHWSMRGRSYAGALRSRGATLVLISLRNDAEVVDAPSIEVPSARAPSEKELALAEQLISALESEFDPTELHSDYEARLRKLVQQKARGKHIRLVKSVKRKPSEGSLEKVLRASVSRARGRERTSA